MSSATRFGGLAIVLAAGVAAGLGLTSVFSGSPADDPCHGQGTHTRDIIGPASAGSKTFTVCRKLGHEVIYDAQTGEGVTESLFDEEVVDYYTKHPDENPVVIANKTADAEFSHNFVTIDVPKPLPAGECPPDSKMTSFPQAGASICMPAEWRVEADTEGGIEIGDDRAIVGIHPRGLTGSYGTRCADPQLVTLPSGVARLCALPVDPMGGQGHGIVLPSGRELGVGTYAKATPADRERAFQVVFSVIEQ